MGRKLFRVLAAKGSDALRQSIRGGRSDGPGAPDHHVTNGPGGILERFCSDDFEFVREQPLFDEQHLIPGFVKSDRANMAGPAADSNIHGKQFNGDRASGKQIVFKRQDCRTAKLLRLEVPAGRRQHFTG
jgi:hypothetical protein